MDDDSGAQLPVTAPSVRAGSHASRWRSVALTVLVVAAGVGAIGSLLLARGEFVVVPAGTAVVTAAEAALTTWVFCLVAGVVALLFLIRARSRSSGSWLLAAGAGLWAVIALVTGALLVVAAVGEGVGAVIYNQMTRVERSPSGACAIVLSETSAFNQTTEELFLVGPLGIGLPYITVTAGSFRPLRSGGVVVTWRASGGSVDYRDDQGSFTNLFTFNC